MGYIDDDLSPYLPECILIDLQKMHYLGPGITYPGTKFYLGEFGYKKLTTEELSKMGDKEIMRIPGIGAVTLNEIRKAIRLYESENSGKCNTLPF